jgi:hypothetical protein
VGSPVFIHSRHRLTGRNGACDSWCGPRATRVFVTRRRGPCPAAESASGPLPAAAALFAFGRGAGRERGLAASAAVGGCRVILVQLSAALAA